MLTRRYYPYYLFATILLLIAACSSSESVAHNGAAIEPVAVQLPVETTVEQVQQDSIAMPAAEDQPMTSDTNQPTVSNAPAPPFDLIFQVHDWALQAGDALRNSCVDAVFRASLANAGQLTLAGTLTLDAIGNSTYTATPTDELRLIDANGVENSLLVKHFEGSNLESAQAFLQGAYQLDCTGSSENFSLNLASLHANNQQEDQLRGWLLVNNRRLEVDLARQSSGTYDLGTGAAHQSAAVVSGFTIVDGVKIEVQQETAYKLVNAAQQIQQAFTLAWTHEGVRYEFQDGYWQGAFYNGVRSEPEYWTAQGNLLRDGRSYGELRMKTMPSSFQLILYTPDQETIVGEWE
jgi:hypothetical protein